MASLFHVCIHQHCIIMFEQITGFTGVFCQLKDGSDKKWKIAKTICNIYIISSITSVQDVIRNGLCSKHKAAKVVSMNSPCQQEGDCKPRPSLFFLSLLFSPFSHSNRTQQFLQGARWMKLSPPGQYHLLPATDITQLESEFKNYPVWSHLL